MNSEKFISNFFIILSLCLSIEIIYMGEYRIIQEGIYLLLVALIVNIFVTMKSMKDSSKVGPILLASNLAADFHLIVAIFACGITSVNTIILNDIGLIISLIVGVSIANLVFLITKY